MSSSKAFDVLGRVLLTTGILAICNTNSAIAQSDEVLAPEVLAPEGLAPEKENDLSDTKLFSKEEMLAHARRQRASGALKRALVGRSLRRIPKGCRGEKLGKRFTRLQCGDEWSDAALWETLFLKAAQHAAYLEFDAVEDEEEVPSELNPAHWHLQNDGQTISEQQGVVDADLQLRSAWEKNAAGQGILVAVIDSGLYEQHIDLRDRIWKNPGEVCDNGLDDDDNGFIDDCSGWDFGEDDNDASPLTLPLSKTSGATCLKWHGSFIAGLVGASQGAGEALGVASHATFLNLKKHTDEGCSSTTFRTIAAVDYALKAGANIVSLSFNTSTHSQILEDLLLEAENQGVLIFMSAGNSGVNADNLERYPAGYPLEHGLVIAGSTNDDTLANGSNYGAESVDVASPGWKLRSVSLDAEDATALRTGTSYAVGTAAGCAATLWSAYPTLSKGEVYDSLLAGADAVSTLNCIEQDVCVRSGARLSVKGAFRAAKNFTNATQLIWEECDILDVTSLPNFPSFEVSEEIALTFTLHNPTSSDFSGSLLLTFGENELALSLSLDSGARRQIVQNVQWSDCDASLSLRQGDVILGERTLPLQCDTSAVTDGGTSVGDDLDAGTTTDAGTRIFQEREREELELEPVPGLWGCNVKRPVRAERPGAFAVFLLFLLAHFRRHRGSCIKSKHGHLAS